jgi:predicted nucleotidyltransferase component of viral defense system
MILANLQSIVDKENQKQTSKLYIRNLLKEYLQSYILYFIYTNDNYTDNLVFTGGTCLRHFYELPRLSEDLDFDYLKKFNSSKLADDLVRFFKQKYQYDELSLAEKQQGDQLLLKFPVLHELDLADKNESDLLYVKVDLSKNPSDSYKIQKSSKSLLGFNFIASHYDLANLFSGKLGAILTRVIKVGKNDRLTIKGRDYYDLIWYLKKGIKPNIKRLSDIINEDISIKELEQRLDDQVKTVIEKYKNDLENDLIPFIENTEFVELFVDNYYEEYLRAKESIF